MTEHYASYPPLIPEPYPMTTVADTTCQFPDPQMERGEFTVHANF